MAFDVRLTQMGESENKMKEALKVEVKQNYNNLLARTKTRLSSAEVCGGKMRLSSAKERKKERKIY